MIRILRSLAFGLSLFMLAGTALAAPPAYKLRVDGLACPFCAYGIEKKLSAIAGVRTIDVDIASGTVTMTEGATLDQATAKEVVKAAGFGLGGFEEVPAAARDRPKK